MPTYNLWQKLTAIHSETLAQFEYVKDSDRYGVPEYWARPDESLDADGKIRGDCEDFAMQCKRKCIEAGIDADDCRKIYCKTEIGGAHCILEVKGWILDNRFREIVEQDSAKGYKFISIKVSEDRWEYLN